MAVKRPHASSQKRGLSRSCAEAGFERRRPSNGREIPTSYGRTCDSVFPRNRYHASDKQRSCGTREREESRAVESLRSVSSSSTSGCEYPVWGSTPAPVADQPTTAVGLLETSHIRGVGLWRPPPV